MPCRFKGFDRVKFRSGELYIYYLIVVCECVCVLRLYIHLRLSIINSRLHLIVVHFFYIQLIKTTYFKWQQMMFILNLEQIIEYSRVLLA